jgi:TolB protein
LVPAFALAALALLPVAARATFAGANGRIAFDDWATGQIYAVNPDGSGLIQLTHAKMWAGDPTYSPDGSQIVYERAQRDRTLLWIMDADGSDKRLVADDRPGGFNFSPVFAPDGQRVVYSRCSEYTDRQTGERHFNCRIFSIATDGTDRRGLTTTHPPQEVFDFEPMVSPDGTTVAFTRHNHNYDGILGQIYLMGIDGSNQRAITAPALEAWFPDWSPDGERIAFTSDCCRPGSAGFVMDADGSDVVQLTHPTFPHNDIHFTYSPDGQQMVFASDRDGDPVCCDAGMFVMNADGSGQTLVDLGLPAPHDFSWGTAPLLSASARAGSAWANQSTTTDQPRCSAAPRPLRRMWGCG